MSWEGGSVPELTPSKGLAEGQGYWGGRQESTPFLPVVALVFGWSGVGVETIKEVEQFCCWGLRFLWGSVSLSPLALS